MKRLALILLACAAGLNAAVVVSGGNDLRDDTWWEAAKDPYSFGEVDANGDGKVDAAEWQAGRNQLERALKETRASIADSLDRDQSGKVSRFEAAAGKARMGSLWQQTRALAIAANDKDTDGKLSEAERKPIAARCAALLTQFGARADANGDQRITSAEAETAILVIIDGKRKLFSLCDRNNDGQLTNKEIELVFDLCRAIAGN